MALRHNVTVPNRQQGDVAEVQGFEVVHSLGGFLALPEDDGADKPDEKEGEDGGADGEPGFKSLRVVLDAPHGIEAVLFFAHEDEALATA